MSAAAWMLMPSVVKVVDPGVVNAAAATAALEQLAQRSVAAGQEVGAELIGAHGMGRFQDLARSYPELPNISLIRVDCSRHSSVAMKRSVAASIPAIAPQSSIENV